MYVEKSLNVLATTEQIEHEVAIPFVYMEDEDFAYVVPESAADFLQDERTSSTTVHYYAVLVVKKDTKEVVKSRYF